MHPSGKNRERGEKWWIAEGISVLEDLQRIEAKSELEVSMHVDLFAAAKKLSLCLSHVLSCQLSEYYVVNMPHSSLYKTIVGMFTT